MKKILTLSLFWLAGLNQAQAIPNLHRAINSAPAVEEIVTTEGYAVGEVDSPENSENLLHRTNSFVGDSRAEMGSQAFPGSTIGRLTSPKGGRCSATLVGPDLIMTAGHCVVDKVTKQVELGNYQFNLGWRRGRTVATAGVTTIWTRYADNRDQDWAILRLNVRLGDRFGWMGIQQTTNSFVMTDSRTLYLAGYGSDYASMEVPFWQMGCRFTNYIQASQNVLHSCSTSPGTSGAAMFVWDSLRNNFYVVGINVASYRDANGNPFFGVPYEDNKANIAVPTNDFYSTLLSALGR